MAIEENKKFSFKRIQQTFHNQWNSQEKKGDDFIKNGENNLFPQYTIDLYNRSSIHAACVNAIVEGIVGEGLTANEESYVSLANKDGETYNDIFAKIALDYKLHGAFAIEIIYSQDRSKIAEIYHIDFSFIRAQEKNSRGKIPGYYISTDWQKVGRTMSVDLEDIQHLPVYNPLNRQEEPNQIYVSHNWRPGQEYYPLSDYVAAYRVIELDQEIDLFHISNVKNGLKPSLSITTFTGGSDDEKRAIEAQLEGNYAGSSNAGSLIYMDVIDPQFKPIIEPIQSNNTDTYYTQINDMVMQKILTAHRITSPLLLGIQQPGALGNRNEMIDAYTLFQTTVINQLRKDILSCLEKVMKFNHPDLVLGIENKKLFEDGEEETEVITDDATTDAENADIQQPEILS